MIYNDADDCAFIGKKKQASCKLPPQQQRHSFLCVLRKSLGRWRGVVKENGVAGGRRGTYVGKGDSSWLYNPKF